MFPEICRICGSKEGFLKHVREGGEDLLEKLRLCANITINSDDDGLPKHICVECLEGLEISNRLRKRAAEMEKRLQSKAQVNALKTEFLEDYEKLIETGMDAELSGSSVEENNFEPAPVEDYENLGNIIVEDSETYAQEDNIYVELCSVEEGIDVVPSNSGRSLKAESTDGEEFMECAPMYSCGTCEQVLSTQTAYRKHIREHGSKRFNCIQCSKWFPTRYRLRKHEVCHSTDTESKHQCVYCGRCYRLHNNLVRHVRAAHEQQRRFTCWLCTESFGRSDVLKNHMLTHTQERNYACEQCSQCFKTQRYLQSHLKMHQPKDPNKQPAQRSIPAQLKPKSYTCEHCGKISQQLFTHKNHLLTHTKERPYECKRCPKKFRTLCALTTHERIHNGQRPYKCDRCSSAFRQHSHLKEHSLIHEGLTPHVCSVCNMRFNKKNNMLVHMKRHSLEHAGLSRDCKSAPTNAASDSQEQVATTPKTKTCSIQSEDYNDCLTIDVVGEEQDIAFVLDDEAKFDLYNMDDILES